MNMLRRPGFSPPVAKVPYSQASGVCGKSVKRPKDPAHTY